MSANTVAGIVYAVCFVALIGAALWCVLAGHPMAAFWLVICAGCLRVKIGGGVCE